MAITCENLLINTQKGYNQHKECLIILLILILVFAMVYTTH